MAQGNIKANCQQTSPQRTNQSRFAGCSRRWHIPPNISLLLYFKGRKKGKKTPLKMSLNSFRDELSNVRKKRALRCTAFQMLPFWLYASMDKNKWVGHYLKVGHLHGTLPTESARIWHIVSFQCTFVEWINQSLWCRFKNPISFSHFPFHSLPSPPPLNGDCLRKSREGSTEIQPWMWRMCPPTCSD